MREKIHIKASHILITSAIIMIYFQIYWHYWFVKLLGGYVVNTLLPIIVLFCSFVFKEFISANWNGRLRRTIFYLSIPLFCYVFFASVSIALNEEGLNNIKSFFIYIYSPVIIFLSIWGLYIYRKNENIKFTLNVLFILSVIFSIYVTIIFSVDPQDLLVMPTIETNRGKIATTSGGTYGVGDMEAVRYTIPGISSTLYGPLLVPLIFVGFYFKKYTKGKLIHFIYTVLILFLIFCVLKTVSRGPLIAMFAGITYLGWRNLLKTKEIVFIASVLVISFLTFAKLALLRLFITIAIFIPFDIPFLDKAIDITDLLKDPRVEVTPETFSQILAHPFMGMGMTNLINLQELSYGKDHNNYLSIAASFGSLTLVFYLLFLFLLFIMTQKAIKRLSWNPTSKDLGIVLSAGCLSLIIYLNFAPAEFHFIWIWFGLAAAWLRNCEDEFLLRKPAIHKLCSKKI